MQFVIVGPHQGKTIKLAGVQFREGTATLPDDARDAHNLLTQFHSAYPANRIRKGKNGVLEAIEAEDALTLDFTPQPLANLAPGTKNVPGAGAESAVDLTKLNKGELVQMATGLGLDVTGTKDEILARIKEDQDKAAE